MERNPKKPSLAETHPELAKQWHPTKNGDLSPEDFISGSGKKVWWFCDKGEDHVWEKRIVDQTEVNKCPFCNNRKLSLTNSLKTKFPEIAQQWHPTKNNNLKPSDVIYSSGKKVWWKCSKAEDHEWQTTIEKRTSGTNCPFCSGSKADNKNNLKAKRPLLAKEWHPTKNGKLKPEDITPRSDQKVWWKCPVAEDHVFLSSPNRRLSYEKKRITFSCPFCRGLKVSKSNSLYHQNPIITKQWHPTKNQELTPKDVTTGSSIKVWWKCPKAEDHEWLERVGSRSTKKSCPFCEGQRVSKTNSFAINYPELVKLWHPTKNKDLNPEDFVSGSGKKVWWKCNDFDDHDHKTMIYTKVKGHGCPYCTGRKQTKSVSFGVKHPDIAKQWHPSKNGKKSPFDVSEFSHDNIWWKCPVAEDHVWQATPATRSRKPLCPMCASSRIVESNSFYSKYPDLVKEWDFEFNKKLNPRILAPTSDKKVWWKCNISSDHRWKTSIVARTNAGTGCPYCTLTPQSKQELIITFELLKFFKDINPKGYKTRLNGVLRAIDIFIPDLNLAIEFDGSYWHKDKRAIDKIKSEMLMDEGYQVIRIREQPLKKIHENDIISKLPYNGKEISDNILKRILELYPVKGPLKQKIQNYISKDGLQNEKALDKYIDQILEEKAASRSISYNS